MAAQLLDQVHANSCPTNITTKARRTADFHPSIWGDYFLKYASDSSIVDDTTIKEQWKQLKEEVKTMLVSTNTVSKLSQTLELIDTIQRLGFSYHFEEELDEILRRVKNICVDQLQNENLHTVSLWFRLLRQEGYGISSEVFKKFTNEEGKFKDELTSDIQGMLSLYEASHLMVNGEMILEEALSYTTHQLQLSIATSSNTSSFLAAQVKHALEQPIRTGLPRVEAKYYISIYHKDPSHSEVLLKFAKLDFNIVQRLHQKELCELTRWWKDLDLESKLSYFRDRFAECYFWMTGIYFEPKYAIGRKILVKICPLLTIFDDTYDVHGTIEELQEFTDAVLSWNIYCLDHLPEYMKSIYKLMIDIYDEIEESIRNEGKGSYQIEYAKNVMKDICKAYLEEAKWFSENYIPTMDEYLQQALVTSGQCFFSITSFLGMGNIATEEAFKWTSKYPKIIRASAIVARLMDDMASHKFEQKRGHVASSVECYAKQYGLSEEETYTELRKLVREAWKDVNEEWIDPKALPIPLLTRMINYPRVVDALYKKEDNFTHAGGLMKDLVTSMFVDSIPM